MTWTLSWNLEKEIPAKKSIIWTEIIDFYVTHEIIDSLPINRLSMPTKRPNFSKMPFFKCSRHQPQKCGPHSLSISPYPRRRISLRRPRHRNRERVKPSLRTFQRRIFRAAATFIAPPTPGLVGVHKIFSAFLRVSRGPDARRRFPHPTATDYATAVRSLHLFR